MPTPVPPATPATPPTPVRRAAALVAVEGVALGVIGAVYAAAGVLGQPTERLGAVLEGVFALVVAALLLVVARGLGAGRGWAWAPTITTQLFLLVVGGYLVLGGVWLAGGPVLLLAVGVLSQLLSPAARASYGEGDRHQG